jgi:hypothetical protein
MTDSADSAAESDGDEPLDPDAPNATFPEDAPIWHPVMDFARLGLPPDAMARDYGDHAWGIEEGVDHGPDGGLRWTSGAIRYRAAA